MDITIALEYFTAHIFLIMRKEKQAGTM